LIDIVVEDFLGPLPTKAMHFFELEKFLDLFVSLLVLPNFLLGNIREIADGRIGNEIEFLDDFSV
jgi:hypothetical protein